MSYQGLFMDTSPYQGELCEIRFMHTILFTSWDVVRKCQKLSSRLNSNRTFCPVNRRFMYVMDSVTPDVGHVLLHYLATGQYRYLKVDSREKFPYFETAKRVFSLAKELELEPLMQWAAQEVRRMTYEMPESELASRSLGHRSFLNSSSDMKHHVDNRVTGEGAVSSQVLDGTKDATGSKDTLPVKQGQGDGCEFTSKNGESYIKDRMESPERYRRYPSVANERERKECFNLDAPLATGSPDKAKKAVPQQKPATIAPNIQSSPIMGQPRAMNMGMPPVRNFCQVPQMAYQSYDQPCFPSYFIPSGNPMPWGGPEARDYRYGGHPMGSMPFYQAPRPYFPPAPYTTTQQPFESGYPKQWSGGLETQPSKPATQPPKPSNQPPEPVTQPLQPANSSIPKSDLSGILGTEHSAVVVGDESEDDLYSCSLPSRSRRASPNTGLSPEKTTDTDQGKWKCLAM